MKKTALTEKEYYKLWHKAQGAAFQDANLDAASEFWILIGPHLKREFPREAVEMLIAKGCKRGTVNEMYRITDKIERLWNGCERCKGSGEFHK